MKLNILIMIFFFMILVDIYFTSALTSPTPSPYPTPSPILICNDVATIDFDGSKIKKFGEEDTPTKMKANLEEIANDASNKLYPIIQNFIAGTYPTSFKCPPGCKIVLSQNSFINLQATTSTSQTNSLVLYSHEGVITKTVISVGGAINHAVEFIMQEIQTEANKYNSCPTGSTRMLNIMIVKFESIPNYIIFTKIPYSITFIINYRVNVKCITTSTSLE